MKSFDFLLHVPFLLVFHLYVPLLCTCHKNHDVCFVRRIALCDVLRALCYSWYVGFWEDCEAECGEGEQVRTVFCRLAQAQHDSYIMVEDDVCLDNPRPISTRPCDSGVPCPEVEEPAVEVEEPAVEIEEHAVEVEEPAVEVEEPVVEVEEPAVVVEEPAVEVEEPVVEVEEPAVEVEEPAVEVEEPAVEVEEPVVEVEEPAVEVEEPAVEVEEPAVEVEEPIIVPQDWSLVGASEEVTQREDLLEPMSPSEDDEPLLETSQEVTQPEDDVAQPAVEVEEPIIVPQDWSLLGTSEEVTQREDPLEPVSPSEDDELLLETSQEVTQPEDDVAQPKDVSPSENLLEPEASPLEDSDLGMSSEWDVSDLFPVTASRPKKLSVNIVENQPLMEVITEVMTMPWDFGPWSAVSFCRLRHSHCTQHKTMNIC